MKPRRSRYKVGVDGSLTLELSDALLYQAGRRVSDLIRQAYDRTTVRQARSAIEYRQQLVAIKALVQDSERTTQERLDNIGKLVEDLGDRPPASHAASVRETLTDDHHRIRNLLGPLRELGFVGREAEPSLRQLELIGTLHDSGATELPPDCNGAIALAYRATSVTTERLFAQ